MSRKVGGGFHVVRKAEQKNKKEETEEVRYYSRGSKETQEGGVEDEDRHTRVHTEKKKTNTTP
jgi:hypothetical protein